MASTEELTVPFFKKKTRGRPATARKRSVSPPASVLTIPVPSSSTLPNATTTTTTGGSKSEVVLPSRKTTSNLLSAGTKRTRGQADDDHKDSDYTNNDNEDGAREREGPDVKWTAEGSHRRAALEILEGDEAEALLAKRLKRSSSSSLNADADAGADEAEAEDGQYRGQKAYRSHLAKNKEVPKAMRTGPQRASAGSSTIRTVTIVDYQPDVCKDYKETGYCGYGDTCKFLHDRGTYLAGWQLDKLAADPKKSAADDGATSDSDSDTEDIPFACLICRKPYTDPVATRCGHYFCASCAVRRFGRTPKCAACGAPTGGMFNRAEKVIEKMRKVREQEEQEEQEAEGGGGGIAIEGLGKAGGGGEDESADDDDDDDDDE